MLLSMTGFSGGNIEVFLDGDKKITFNVELKSLNSRFFEVACRLPSSLNFLETTIASLLKEKLVRGRAYLTVSAVAGDVALEALDVSPSVVETYVSASKTLKDKFNLPGDLEISDILSMPNIFTSQKVDIGSSSKKQILDAIGSVADKLVEARGVEGSNLEKDIKKQVDLCSKTIEKIGVLHEKLIKEQKKLASKTLEKSQGGDEEAKIQLDEVYAMLNKMDINEEIIRFKSHLKNLETLFDSKGVEKGKRFDFILQELLRETNTISAKCSNFDINSFAIDIKVELEKAREQVQNVL